MRTIQERIAENRIYKAAKFIKALVRLMNSGRGTLPSATIQKRFDICKTCEDFTGSRCRVCGCGINGKKSLLNKLCYPTERCPANPPKWDYE